LTGVEPYEDPGYGEKGLVSGYHLTRVKNSLAAMVRVRLELVRQGRPPALRVEP